MFPPATSRTSTARQRARTMRWLDFATSSVVNLFSSAAAPAEGSGGSCVRGGAVVRGAALAARGECGANWSGLRRKARRP